MWWSHERRSLYIFYLDNMEIWKDIPWYEWLYQVSNLGRVKSLWNGNSNASKVRILSPRKCAWWQTTVMLCRNAIEKRFAISRLVAQSFLWLDISDTKMCVCHKDETMDEEWRLYNWADNLFLGTHAENMRDMKEKGRAPRSFLGKFWKLSTTAKAVKQFTLSGEFIKEWESIKMAYHALWIDDRNIGKCCKWLYKQTGGFIWQYSNNGEN